MNRNSANWQHHFYCPRVANSTVTSLAVPASPGSVIPPSWTISPSSHHLDSLNHDVRSNGQVVDLAEDQDQCLDLSIKRQEIPSDQSLDSCRRDKWTPRANGTTADQFWRGWCQTSSSASVPSIQHVPGTGNPRHLVLQHHLQLDHLAVEVNHDTGTHTERSSKVSCVPVQIGCHGNNGCSSSFLNAQQQQQGYKYCLLSEQKHMLDHNSASCVEDELFTSCRLKNHSARRKIILQSDCDCITMESCVNMQPLRCGPYVDMNLTDLYTQQPRDHIDNVPFISPTRVCPIPTTLKDCLMSVPRKAELVKHVNHLTTMFCDELSFGSPRAGIMQEVTKISISSSTASVDDFCSDYASDRWFLHEPSSCSSSSSLADDQAVCLVNVRASDVVEATPGSSSEIQLKSCCLSLSDRALDLRTVFRKRSDCVQYADVVSARKKYKPNGIEEEKRTENPHPSHNECKQLPRGEYLANSGETSANIDNNSHWMIPNICQPVYYSIPSSSSSWKCCETSPNSNTHSDDIQIATRIFDTNMPDFSSFSRDSTIRAPPVAYTQNGNILPVDQWSLGGNETWSSDNPGYSTGICDDSFFPSSSCNNAPFKVPYYTERTNSSLHELTSVPGVNMDCIPDPQHSAVPHHCSVSPLWSSQPRSFAGKFDTSTPVSIGDDVIYGSSRFSRPIQPLNSSRIQLEEPGTWLHDIGTPSGSHHQYSAVPGMRNVSDSTITRQQPHDKHLSEISSSKQRLPSNNITCIGTSLDPISVNFQEAGASPLDVLATTAIMLDRGGHNTHSRANIANHLPSNIPAMHSECHLASSCNVSSAYSAMRKFSCTVCGSSFKEKSNLNRHMRIHTALRPYHCHLCSKTFKVASTLYVHKMTHQSRGRFVCDVCNKDFKRPEHLRQHRRIHTGERPYQCGVCQCRFTTDNTLRAHMRRHTGERPYECPVCGKRFTQSSAMKTHWRRHGDQRDFACHLCPMRFKQKYDLTRHGLAHTNLRPFSCQQCSMTFKSRANLRKHCETHAGRRKNSSTSSRILQTTTLSSPVFNTPTARTSQTGAFSDLPAASLVNISTSDPVISTRHQHDPGHSAREKEGVLSSKYDCSPGNSVMSHRMLDEGGESAQRYLQDREEPAKKVVGTFTTSPHQQSSDVGSSYITSITSSASIGHSQLNDAGKTVSVISGGGCPLVEPKSENSMSAATVASTSTIIDRQPISLSSLVQQHQRQQNTAAQKPSCQSRYICLLCGLSYTRNYNLKLHIERNHMSEGRQVTTGRLLSVPTSEQNNEAATPRHPPPMKCDVCEEIFWRKSALKRHMWLLHGRGERPPVNGANQHVTEPTLLPPHCSQPPLPVTAPTAVSHDQHTAKNKGPLQYYV